MKLVGWMGAAVLSLTLGIAAPAFSQQDQHEQEKDKEHKEKPSPQKEKTKQADQHAKAAHEAAHTVQQKGQVERQTEPKVREPQPAHEAAHTVQQRTVEHTTVQETHTNHGGGHRIPEDRYRAHFGQEHRFHVSQADYSRNHRFQYGGYWFGFAGAWPSNWLYTEDVYVVEIDGVYYLCNPQYPGVNILINVEE
jgi:hypothetical protein